MFHRTVANLGITVRILSLGFVFVAAAFAQTATFTYQGKLNDAGSPANSTYDMQFKLFDAAAGTGQIGPTVMTPGVQATAGVFAVELDFGAASFSGADRFLEIRVSPAGQGSFTTLAPRQKLTSSPYAIKSAIADNALSLGGTSAGQFVQTADPRMTDARAPQPGSADYIQNGTVVQPGTNFNISGTGAANIVNAATQFNLGGLRVLSVAGTNNVFAGVGAGTLNTFGSSNAFFGRGAGAANSTGANNAFFGDQAGAATTTGFNNAFFGRNAGAANTSASNAFFGDQSGMANTTASSNAFFGANSGVANTTGNQNAFFGAGAGAANTTAGNNAFFGYRAGEANTTGTANAYFGNQAGAANTTAGNNSFFGSNAGFRVTAAGNSFFGSSAGSNTTTGTSNSFFGSQTGFSNTTASLNSFFGSQAGFSTTTGINNAFFGQNAGFNNTTGSNNIFIGGSAGNPNTATQVSNSMAIGNNATVSANNTIVLGTSSHTTNMPGHLAVSGGGLTTFLFGLSGVLVNNLVIRRLASGDVLPSQAHVCFRTTAVGSDGGWGLTTCSAAFAPSENKTEIQPFAAGLDVVRRLSPVSFKWKDGNANNLGLNAEEVAEVAPQLVKRNVDGKVEDVEESGLMVVFINAFKEQQKQIESQREEIDALKRAVCRLDPQTDLCSRQR